MNNEYRNDLFKIIHRYMEEYAKDDILINESLPSQPKKGVPMTNHDKELYQQVTDICAENGGVTKTMVDKLLHLITTDRERAVREARIDELEKLVPLDGRLRADTFHESVYVVKSSLIDERIATLSTQEGEVK